MIRIPAELWPLIGAAALLAFAWLLTLGGPF